MTGRTPLIVGNWKMNLEEWQATALAGSIADAVPAGNVEVVVCPPFPWLVPVAAVLEGSRVGLGAQDCSAERAGAFTGQVSAAMLNGLCTHVIVGHSEHRRDCCETDALVARKATAALEAGLVPIVCVGEALEEREAGSADDWVGGQVQAVIDQVGHSHLARVVFAYEPIWAIGTGRSAAVDDAEAMCSAIRGRLAPFGDVICDSVRILYGGSVNADNAASYLGAANVDGLLVGGASLSADSFLSIVGAAT